MKHATILGLGLFLLLSHAQAKENLMCQNQAKTLIKSVVSNKAVTGRFLETAPQTKLVAVPMGPDEKEVREVYTFSHPDGDNTLTLTLTHDDLCELRKLIHNITL